MNLTQYNALTGDTKLAAALAISMGWKRIQIASLVLVWDEHKPIEKEADETVPWRIFDPFSDASIPYGLPIGNYILSGDFAAFYFNETSVFNKSKNTRNRASIHSSRPYGTSR
jgi:hypothetical protein